MRTRTSVTPLVRYLVASGLALVLLAATVVVAPVAAGDTLLGDRGLTDVTSDLIDDLPGADGLAGLDVDAAEFETLVYRADEVVELEEQLDHGPPIPEDSVGIGPGSTLLINVYDEDDPDAYTGLCTAAFIFRDTNTGKVYLGSAGHCFIDQGATSTHGDDADWDPADTRRVRVCVENCLGGASGLASDAVLGVYPGTTRDLGDLVYARQATGSAEVGHDFGIVEIPEELHDEIRTDMPMWNGPRSADLPGVEEGDVIVHYGNGVAVGEVVPTKGRAGMGVTSNATSWRGLSAASPGDSGSAVNIASVTADDLVEGETAAGVLTHLSIGVSPGVIVGTTTARAIEMAQEAGFDLELIYDVAQLEESGDPDPGDPGEPSEDLEASIEATDRERAGTTITFDGSGSTGDIAEWHWDMGDGTVYEGSDLETVDHYYEQPGPKDVVLTVTDGEGNTDTATHRIRVQGPPAPN